MGFSVNLLIAHPRRGVVYQKSKFHDDQKSPLYTPEEIEARRKIVALGPKKNYTIWEVREVLEIGRVTRLEKITSPAYKHLSFSGRERAGICTVSWMFPKLVEKLQHVKKTDFAPMFVITATDSDQSASFSEWNHKNLDFQKLEDGQQFIRASLGTFGRSGLWYIPDHDRMHGHNRLCAFTDEELNEFIDKKYNVVFDPLYMWESCAVVAEWLTEMMDLKTESWLELEKDPISLGYWRVWRAYLTEMGRMDTRVLFHFD